MDYPLIKTLSGEYLALFNACLGSEDYEKEALQVEAAGRLGLTWDEVPAQVWHVIHRLAVMQAHTIDPTGDPFEPMRS